MASTSQDTQVSLIETDNSVLQGFITDDEVQLIKDEYNEKLHSHFLSTKASEVCSKMTNLWSHNCLDPLILRIQKEKQKSGEAGIFIYKHEDKLMMIGNWRDNDRLFLKDEDGKFKVILPWEDIFDIFWEAHRQYCHPSTETLKNILQDDYIVNDFAIQNISEVCYKCSGLQKAYYRCSLDITTINETVDYAFTHLMVYQDLCTGYIHLRPLSTDCMEIEITEELLKIFMDFGPPKQILISCDTFRVSLDQIKQLTTFAPIPITVFKVTREKDKFVNLTNAITEWMGRNKFEHWSIACYGVQLYLNNQIKSHGQKSPYDKIFKKIKRCGVEDLNKVGFDSVQFASDAGIDKAVSTSSPLNCNAAHVEPDRNSEEQGNSSSSPLRERQIISEEFMDGSASSDDTQADEEDPLAIIIDSDSEL